MPIDYASEFDDGSIDYSAEFSVPAPKNDGYLRTRLTKARQERLKPRSAWDRFKDQLYLSTLHSPWGGEAVVRHGARLQGMSDAEINRRERAAFKQGEIMDARDAEAFKNVDTLSPANIGKWVVDLTGNFVGGVDPTVVLGPGKTIAQRVLAQGGINAGIDAASQGVEKLRGTRDEYDPMQTAVNAIVGLGMQGAGEGVAKVRLGRRLNAGARMGNFDDLVNTVIGLEGGGTLANPKTSPKGAKGPMQVMDATARDPGFGIRPWNGKTEADRARVGRQYLAALNHKYNGDTAKVLAAYNGGPGRVDAAVKKYGSEWLRAMPLESRNYVRNGLGKTPKDFQDEFPQWEATDQTFKPGYDEVFAPSKSDVEEARLEPIRDALMRQAEDDNSFVKHEQPTVGEQGYVNNNLGPEGTGWNPIPKGEAPVLKAAHEYTDAEWAKLSIETKKKALGYGNDVKLNDQGGIKLEDTPGTPEFDKKYGYDKAMFDSEDQKAWDSEQKPFDPEDEDTWGINDGDSELDPVQPHYDYLDAYSDPFSQYKEKYGTSVDPTWTKAIDDVAYHNGVHPFDVAEAVFNNESVKGLDVKKISSDVQELAEKYWMDENSVKPVEESSKPASEATSLYFPHKVGNKEKPVKTTPSALAKAGATFLRMLKDNKGELSPSPDKFHEAITEWNKGTHYLLKGEDGTPLRIYHGTRYAYEGMPSGEKNRMPKGYVLYSTDPDFASNYANPRWANEPVTNARVFPAYVKNDRQIADFRKPEDLKKAIDWYKKRYGHALSWGTEHDLARGAWDQWERPEMLKDNGWKGAFLTEGMGDDKGPRLNIMLEDHLVMSILDPKTYKNDTVAHKIVNVLGDLLKDESGSYRITDPLDDMDADERTLLDALKNARKVSGETRSLHRVEKGKRGAQLGRIQQEGLGEVGLYAQMKQAKGEMPKADFESLRDAFSQDQIDSLLNKINNNKELLPWEKFNASMAMGKLIGLEGANFSKAPTMSEIKLLEKVYSSKLISALMEDRTFTQKLVQGFQKTLSIPRSIMSSMDLSAPFRQGLNYIHKPEFWKAFGHMFKLVASEANSKALMDEIHSRPTWELMKRARLAITDPHSHFMDEREEMFGDDWAEKIPILGSIGIKASNRAYSGFLNKLRADVFDDYVRQYEKAGINLATDTQKLRQVAAFVNAATGRGNLPKRIEAAAPFLSGVFFSPRLIASRLKFVANPLTYLNADPILRKEAWKSAFSLAAVAISVGSLAKYGLGLELETDPRSSDFMKPKIGNTRYDVMGGYQQYITLAARFITEQEKTGSGNIRDFDKDNPTANNRGKAVLKFARNKLSPVASFVTDWMMGKDTVGRDFKLSRAAADRITPMAAGDIADAFEEWKNDSVAKGPAMAAPGMFGVGVQTYDPEELKAEKEAKKPVQIDKEFSSEFSDEFSTVDFSKEFE